MDEIVMAAGTTLVTAMATEAWQQARDAVVALWRKRRPEQAQSLQDELSDTRSQVLIARREGDSDTEQALTGSWQIRLQRELRNDLALAAELKRVLDQVLARELSPAELESTTNITMRATATDQGRIYQAGRDQRINER